MKPKAPKLLKPYNPKILNPLILNPEALNPNTQASETKDSAPLGPSSRSAAWEARSAVCAAPGRNRKTFIGF